MLKDKMSLTPAYDQCKTVQDSECNPDSLTEHTKGTQSVWSLALLLSSDSIQKEKHNS